jgi:hypothetical protein
MRVDAVIQQNINLDLFAHFVRIVFLFGRETEILVFPSLFG